MKKAYLIRTISNTHVGSGDVNYGVIDNLIQRDPITNLPVFHSSSLKGALREELESRNFQHVKDIFGSKPKDSRENTSPGKARFFEARLLSVPVRSDRAAYFMVTSPAIIREFIDQVSMLGCKVPEQCITHLESVLQNELVNTFKDYKDPQALTEEKKLEDACLEELSLKAKFTNHIGLKGMEKLFGERLVLVNEAAMKLITDDTHLPVMARNCLETGNENLWYEQVLPRFTRLYTIFFSDTKKEKSSMKAFFDELNQGVFQIGANASIGYGFCKFDDIETLLNSASHENKK